MEYQYTSLGDFTADLSSCQTYRKAGLATSVDKEGSGEMFSFSMLPS